MSHYDAVISTSCYMSPGNAINFIKSIPVLKGNVLPIITCPRLEDAQAIAEFMRVFKPDVPCVILTTIYNSRYFCQSIGFVYSVTHGISARYFAVVDDDIEFIDDQAFNHIENSPPFSVFGFSSNQIMYGKGALNCLKYDGKYGIFPAWLDANNMWSLWETNLLAGVPDSAPGVQNCAFTEVEYQHRLRMLSGKPTVGCAVRAIRHNTRDPRYNLEKLRGNINIAVEGFKLWQQKFNFALDGGQFNARKITWEDVYHLTNKEPFWPQYKRHLVFGGLWLNWDEIWTKYSPGINTIYKVLG